MSRPDAPAALPVYLHGTRVGSLRAGRIPRFAASVAALERWGYGSRVLSVSLPLEPGAAQPEATAAFFGGLLPEGGRLTDLARAAGCASGDLVGLLRFAGADVAGGLVLPGPEITALGPVLTAQEFADELADPSRYLGGGGSSVAGLRPKVALGRSPAGWHAATGGHPSTHILKPVDGEQESLAREEVYLLDLARRLGLTDRVATFERVGSTAVVCVERYDRTLLTSSEGRIDVRRTHQEDAAQALGLPWATDSKYESVDARATYRAIAGLLDSGRTLFAGRSRDRVRLAQMMAFTVAIGNTDAHAKNHSLLHDDHGSVELAPIYDLTAPILHYGANLNLALRVNGRSYLPEVTLSDLVAEAESWGLPQGLAAQTVRTILEDTVQAVSDGVPVSVEPPARLRELVVTVARNLLDGRQALPHRLIPPALQQAFAPGP